MKRFHTALLALVTVLILYFLGAFLIHLQMFLSNPLSAPKTEIPVVGFDWTERHSHKGYAPFFMCQGRLLSSDYNQKQIGLSNAALSSEEKDINGMKYPGFSIVGHSVVDKTEKNVFSFHFRTMQDDRVEDYVEMYIDADVEFAIVIDNFENGILCDVKTAGAYEKLYRFRAGRYHLQAMEKKNKMQIKSKREKYIRCRFNYSIRDWFRDPFDIRIELPRCTPFRINADQWRVTLVHDKEKYGDVERRIDSVNGILQQLPKDHRIAGSPYSIEKESSVQDILGVWTASDRSVRSLVKNGYKTYIRQKDHLPGSKPSWGFPVRTSNR